MADGTLPGYGQARGIRSRIADLLPDMDVAAAVAVITLTDGTVLELTVPHAAASLHVAGHTPLPPLGRWDGTLPAEGWAVLAFRARDGADLRVRILHEGDGHA